MIEHIPSLKSPSSAKSRFASREIYTKQEVEAAYCFFRFLDSIYLDLPEEQNKSDLHSNHFKTAKLWFQAQSGLRSQRSPQQECFKGGSLRNGLNNDLDYGSYFTSTRRMFHTF